MQNFIVLFWNTIYVTAWHKNSQSLEIILQLGYQASEVPALTLYDEYKALEETPELSQLLDFAPLVSTFQVENNSYSSVIKKISVSDNHNIYVYSYITIRDSKSYQYRSITYW